MSSSFLRSIQAFPVDVHSEDESLRNLGRLAVDIDRARIAHDAFQVPEGQKPRGQVGRMLALENALIRAGRAHREAIQAHVKRWPGP